MGASATTRFVFAEVKGEEGRQEREPKERTPRPA